MHRRKFFSGALILYLCVVGWVVLLSRVPSEEVVIKLHSETILFLLGHYPDWQHDVTALHPEGMVREDILNILLFLPLGFLMGPILRGQKRRNTLLWCTAIGFCCSLLIESLQLLTKRGWFDTDDLLMNTLGALVGSVIYYFLKRFYKVHNGPENK